MLVDPDIGLFRADEGVFTAMLDGWRAQMLARGLTTQTIKQRCQLLERFQRVNFRGNGARLTLMTSWPICAPARNRSA